MFVACRLPVCRCVLFFGCVMPLTRLSRWYTADTEISNLGFFHMLVRAVATMSLKPAVCSCFIPLAALTNRTLVVCRPRWPPACKNCVTACVTLSENLHFWTASQEGPTKRLKMYLRKYSGKNRFWCNRTFWTGTIHILSLFETYFPKFFFVTVVSFVV